MAAKQCTTDNFMTDEEIKNQLIENLVECLDGGNQGCCNPVVLSIDKENGRCIIEMDLVVVEEDKFAGFEGY